MDDFLRGLSDGALLALPWLTTTPRNVGVLKAILRNPSTVVTHAPTEANRAYLAASFFEEVQARYGGTRLGRVRRRMIW
ncbi:MAG: hypothetical protein ACO2ZK_07140, partial [Gemmobacter sp.]